MKWEGECPPGFHMQNIKASKRDWHVRGEDRG